MAETDCILMSLLIFVPTAFALSLLLVPGRWVEFARWWTLLGTAVTLVLSLCVLNDYRMELQSHAETGRPGYSREATLEGRHDAALKRLNADIPQPPASRDMLARRPWIGQFGIDYYIGVDGISLPLVLLTTVLMLLAVLASWKIERHVRAYLALLLLLETGVLGSFLALDFFLFYVFFEVMLIPMYFLIGLWGGQRREYAALKFFIYTLTGSVLILIAMLACYSSADVRTFDLVALQKAGQSAADAIRAGDVPTSFGASAQTIVFLLLFIGFAIKVPLFPLHSWLPDAHVEAPTPISMILAGILLKLGGYGLLRIAVPVCPYAAESLAWWMGLAGALSILYGALVAMGQSDFKRLLAYSSISHMGYVILGIACFASAGSSQYWSWGVEGAIYQMVAHGITSAALFFIVGVAYERAHHRDLNNYRGLMEPMPLFGGLSALMIFASMGLPGLCGFVGEFMVMVASWHFAPALSLVAIGTTVLTAAYLLWTFQRVYLGTNSQTAHYRDLSMREALTLIPLAALALLLGVWPNVLLHWIDPSVTEMVGRLAK